MSAPLHAPSSSQAAIRTPLARMRANAMLAAYSVGVPVVLAMVVHDALFAKYGREINIAANLSFVAVLLAGIAAVRRGRDDLGAYVVPALTGLLSVSTLITASGPNPIGFFDGWARWYAVFIASTVLFGPPRTAIAVTALSIGWTLAYEFLFCRNLPPALAEKALSETVEVTMVLTMSGALALTAIHLVQRAMGEAETQLATSQRLAASLEARVAARTAELDDALAERLAILDHLAEGLVAVDPSGRVRSSNPALLALYGATETPLGRLAEEALPQDLWAPIALAAQSAELVEVDVALPGRRVGRVAASPLSGGRGVVALVRDVTLEREIDRMKTDFTATVSHELRTPLTSVLGFAKLIRNKLDLIFGKVPEPEEKVQRAMTQVRGNVDVIIREGERLTALINDVLDISKMEAGRMEWRREEVDVAEVVRSSVDAVRPLFPPGGPDLQVRVADGLPTLVGDRHRLVQVLVNLLSNAAKFTVHGHVRVEVKPATGGVLVAVSDTGGGIDPALHEAVFEKFRQVGDALTDKPTGTGLGLPICRQIVRAHGSDLRIDSALGVGARFWFVLPRDGVEAAPANERGARSG